MTDPSPPDPRGLARDAAAASALLGVDLGTSSAKAAVFDASGGLLAASSAPYPVRSDRPGWAETDPEDWWSAVVSAVGAAVGQSGAQIAAMGLCGQMHGVVLCDGAGRALRPALLWPDSRAADELEAYRRLTEAQRLRLANPLSPGMAGPMLAWLRRHEPDRCEQARWALQPKDLAAPAAHGAGGRRAQRRVGDTAV